MRSSVVILLATAFSGVADAFANIGCMNPGFMNNTYQGQPDLENVITSPVHPANSYVGCPVSGEAKRVLTSSQTYCKALLQQMISDTPVGDIPGVILASAFRPLTGRAPGEGECYCVNSAEAFSAKAVEFGKSWFRSQVSISHSAPIFSSLSGLVSSRGGLLPNASYFLLLCVSTLFSIVTVFTVGHNLEPPPGELTSRRRSYR